MKKLFALIIILTLLSPIYAREENIRLTIYNRGIVQVAEIRQLELQKGENWITFANLPQKIISETANLRPISAEAKLAILQADYLYDTVDLEKIWGRYIGEIVNVTADSVPITGILLNFDDTYLYLQPDTGGVRLVERSSLDQLNFPALKEGLVSQPELHYLVDNRGSKGKYDFELSYLSGGMSWSVYYSALYRQGILELSGDFVIDNQIARGFDGAELSLIAGEAHMSFDKEELPRTTNLLEGAKVGTEGEPLFAYYVYPVEVKVNIPQMGQKHIPFLSSAQFPAREKYVMKEGFGLRNLETVIAFTAGGKPFPEGDIAIYRPDKDGEAQLVGEDHLYNTPAGGEVEIRVGKAFDLQGDRKRVSHQRLDRNATEDVIRVKLINGSNVDKEVVVRERLFGVWTIQTATFNGMPLEYSDIDSRTVEFKVLLKKNSVSNLEYKARYEY